MEASLPPSQKEPDCTGHPKENGLTAVCNNGTDCSFLLLRQELWDNHNAWYATPFVWACSLKARSLSLSYPLDLQQRSEVIVPGGAVCADRH